MFLKNIVFLLACVHFGSSIKCFECNSANNSMCLNPNLYDPETIHNFLPITECRHGVQAVSGDAGGYNFFCRKIEQTILHKHYEPEVRVTRGCGWRQHYKPCYKADNEDHLETVCQCFTDACNSADVTSQGRAAAIFVLLSLVMLK
ncbi:uncharacterized protein LOC126374039 [Pectinophora gossypiella]|uniref:uncharacterized protein LOC126374039 n=1 Tax=Pectinophora gossypiella TaxID=13191 RepID=UPI00214E3270|nr:uncharacterized protein LOC126374039 [Pectinophora gossypiella]